MFTKLLMIMATILVGFSASADQCTESHDNAEGFLVRARQAHADTMQRLAEADRYELRITVLYCEGDEAAVRTYVNSIGAEAVANLQRVTNRNRDLYSEAYQTCNTPRNGAIAMIYDYGYCYFKFVGGQ